MNQGVIAYLDMASLIPVGGGYTSPGENLYSKLASCNTLVMRIPYDINVLYVPASLVFSGSLVYIESTFSIGVLHYHLHGVCDAHLPDRINYAIVRDNTDSILSELSTKVQDLEENFNHLSDVTVIGTDTGRTLVISALAGPARRLTVDIEASQEGEGTPSPENIRTITGWNNVEISANTQTITIGTGTAGTVYGGVLDVLTGVLTLTHYCKVFDGTENWQYRQSWISNAYVFVNQPDPFRGSAGQFMCSHYLAVSTGPSTANRNNKFWTTQGEAGITFYIGETGANTEGAVALKQYLAEQYSAGTPVTCVYPMETPVSYNTVPSTFATVDGVNVIAANCGPVTIDYIRTLEI